jgi:hypothetical protein
MQDYDLPEDALPEETGTQKSSSSGKTREQIQDEIRAMAEQAKKHAQGSLFEEEPSTDDEDDELGGFSLRNIADRDESHRLYYGLYNIMKRNLPKGPANLPLRRYVYDEVLLYLNQGKRKNAQGIRGSSGQMAYIPTILQPAWSIAMNWVTNGANPFDLYSAFEAQNIALGYHGGGSTPPTSPATPTVPNNPVPSNPVTSAAEAIEETE